MLKLFRVFVIISLAVFAAALFLPWTTFNLHNGTQLTSFTVTPLNVYQRFIPYFTFADQINDKVNNETYARFPTSVLLTEASVALYAIAIVSGFVCLVTRRLKILSGACGIASGAVWIESNEMLKNFLIQQSSSGATVVGKISPALLNMVVTGYGTYVAIAGGAIVLISGLLKRGGQPPVKLKGSKLQASDFLGAKIDSLLDRLELTSATVMAQDDASKVFTATKRDGMKVLVFCDYRAARNPVQRQDVDSFIAVVKEEQAAKNVNVGIYVTNADFERGCQGGEIVGLVDGKRLDELLRSK